MMEDNQAANSQEEDVLSGQVVVANEHGLHARPAGLVAQRAQGFEADIKLVNAEQEVDAKSILDVLTLAAAPGDVLEIRVQGADAADALASLTTLFKNKFTE